MLFNDISFRNNKIDYLLSVTALLQPVLTLLQLFLMDAMHMDPEAANRVRVMSTAFPILLSIIFVFRRNFKLAVVTFLIVVLVLFITVLVYPSRWAYMSNDVLKFTLPVIIPIGLCIASVKNFAVFAKSMQYVSLFAATIGLFYAAVYLSGGFFIDSYSMTFSYALLFPTFIMITKKSWIWKSIAVILMIEMLAIGSRGAIMLSITYWLFTMFWGKLSFIKIVMYTIILYVAYFLFFETIINALANLFESVGINSRTLRLLVNDELVSHDSGRDFIYQQTWRLIDQKPLFGNGVWADREFLDMYCHNVFLELLLDFGYVGTGLILIVFGIKQFKIFKKIPMGHKTMYLMMFGILCPLFVSSSYLTSFNVGMFLGFSYLLSKIHDYKLFQDYEFK